MQSGAQMHTFCTMCWLELSRSSNLPCAFGDLMPASVTSHGFLHPFLVGISGLIILYIVYSIHSSSTTGFSYSRQSLLVSSHTVFAGKITIDNEYLKYSGTLYVTSFRLLLERYFITITLGQSFVKIPHRVTSFNILPCCSRSINCIFKIKGSLKFPHTAVRIH